MTITDKRNLNEIDSYQQDRIDALKKLIEELKEKNREMALELYQLRLDQRLMKT